MSTTECVQCDYNHKVCVNDSKYIEVAMLGPWDLDSFFLS